jgi:TrmH family RNA methyltransferase
LFRVEGLAHVGAALESTAPVEFLIASLAQFRSDYAHTLVAQATQKDIPVFEVSPDIFTSLAEKENPQGLLAVVRRVQSSLRDFNPTSHPWLVAAVAPQDPGNVGTLLRTIDAVGASGLVLLDDSVDPTHPTAVSKPGEPVLDTHCVLPIL